MTLDLLNLKNKAFGLDISDLSVKAVDVKSSKKGFLLSSFGKIGLPSGVVKNGQILNKKFLAKKIKELLSSIQGEKIKSKYVIASLPEEKAFLQVIQMPKMKEEELKKAVLFEAENYIPFSLDKVYIDSQWIKPVYDHLDHADVLLVAFPKKIADDYVEVIKMAGLEPLVLEPESQAIVRALFKKEVSVRPVLVLDFGATKTTFIIFAGYSVHFTSTIPVSSKSFTEEISRTMRMSFDKAEQAKIKYGLLKKGKTGLSIFEALIPGLTDLSEQIKKHIDYYQTHAKHMHLGPGVNNDVSKILICGGGANLKGFVKFISSEFNLPTIKAKPVVDFDKEKITTESVSSYITAIGLAIRGSKLSFPYA